MLKFFKEIKNRIFFMLIACFFVTVVAYFYKETILFLMVAPCKNSYFFKKNIYFIFTNVTEVFVVYLRIIFFLVHQTLCFFLMFHCFVFFGPAVYHKEYFILFKLLFFFILSWVFSFIFFNYILFPFSWDFFLTFQDVTISKFMNVHFESKLNEYVEFYFSLYYVCWWYFTFFTGVFFFLLLLGMKLKSIKKFRKFYYFIFVVFSTSISPPDVFSQLILSFLTILFYELLVLNFIFKNSFLIR